MKLFSDLKTSEKISLSFSLFGFFSLLLFLLLINISYFFIWYSEQKALSFSGMNESYVNYLKSEGSQSDIDNFKEYLLSRDTLIIPEMWELLCSPGVAKKIHEDPEEIKNKFFYRDEDTVYFIYSRYLEWVGEVKVFFDTTQYITTQITIIKMGLIFIFVVFLLQFFLWKYITKRLLRDLTRISRKVSELDIHQKNKHVICKNIPKNDEIRILAEALNTSYDHIDAQTSQLKQFLTDVAHEFKTPLMVMNSRIDVVEKKLEKWQSSEEDRKKFFSDFRKHISHLNKLLETLFFLSRVEENKWCLVKEKLHIKSYIEKKLSGLAEKFPDKHITFSIDIAEHLEYEVEQQTFSILLDNLLSNAVKFSPKRTKIIIRADESSLSVSDNGPGIEVSQREEIWKKFYRKDTKKEGFWVGLYLVKRITHIYNWSIEVEESSAGWAKFIISL